MGLQTIGSLFILNEVWKHNTKREIIHVAKYFKQEPINISKFDYNNFEYINNLKINKESYKSFKKEFIVDGQGIKKTSYEILSKYLKKI